MQPSILGRRDPQEEKQENSQVRVVFTEQAIESLKNAPQAVRRAFAKQLRLLVQNLLHPSLHAKKTMNRKISGRRESIAIGASISRSRMMSIESRRSFLIRNKSIPAANRRLGERLHFE